MRDRIYKSQVRARGLRQNMPEAEHRLWYFIRNKQLGGFRFRKQHPVGQYIVDFACAKQNLIIEVDGATHSTDAEVAYDARRTQFLESKGGKVIRYPNEDIYKQIDDVLDDITAHLKKIKINHPHSSTAIAGEVAETKWRSEGVHRFEKEGLRHDNCIYL